MCISPDTGAFVPWSMRMSSFIPMNTPIAFGMLMTAPTPFNTILWQWVNQTYNAALNYGNRNASSNYTTEDILKSYFSAATIAIILSLGIRKAVASRVAGSTGAKMVLFNTISTYAACGCGGFVNAYLMRQTEIKTGINVIHPETNEPVGVSKKCAEIAVFNTGISRFGIAAPLFIPAFCMFGIERLNMVPKAKVPRLCLDMCLVVINCYVAIPLGVAMYPSISKIKAEDLEPEFHQVKG